MDIVSIRKKTIKAILNIFYNLYKINEIVKKYEIEILYGNNTLDILLISLYKKYINSNIKVISHIHDILEKKMYINYIKRNSKYIDKFIVPSIVTKKSLDLCNINNEKIEVVYNGIELYEIKREQYNFIREKYNISEDKKVICIIGQICERKRQDLFIDIVNCLNKKYNNKYIGIIIGKITDKSFYEKIKLKIQYPILFINDMKREEIFEYIYPNIDALILLSDRDPLPTVILEAMSRGTIVIARDVDGVSEIIENNKNGYIFKYNDSVPQIANFIEDIMVKPKNIKEIVKNNAKERIKNFFKLENKIKQINNLLEDD